jgi:hypothetical protein
LDKCSDFRDIIADCRLHAGPGAFEFHHCTHQGYKVLELEKGSHAMDRESSGVKDLTRNLQKATKHGVKKAVGAGIPNTNWIAKIVGKVTKELEAARGDAGYSGEISVRLDKYRPNYPERLSSKLLP